MVLLALAGLVTNVSVLVAADAPRFLGAQSCSTSGCHGGGDDKNRQYTVWSRYDVHHERPFATLTTARSERIAETLQLGNPTQAPRCTVCHAPMQTVPASQRDSAMKISDGVSCENCHGPAEHWLRAHTRKDYTHADRVRAGMRDLQDLHVRANTCVACHQNVDADILAAGHPELIFELDGQAVTQPKHWRETNNWNGAQTWFIGQLVAKREMNWQLSHEKEPTQAQTDRHQALVWLMSVVNGQDATGEWTDETTRRNLNALANYNTVFHDSSISQSQQARLAERMVLALDRLVAALPGLCQNEPVQAALKQLFKDAQSLPDFNPNQFADHLAEFQKALPAAP